MPSSFVHHYTGDWVRPNANNSAFREQGFVREYDNLAQVTDAFAQAMFQKMLENEQIVISSGSHIFQIRN